MQQKLNASKLRIILFITLLLIAVLAVAGFYFVQSKLSEYSRSISQLNADTAASNGNVETLRYIKQYLAEHTSVISKAQSIVADSKSYAYQDQIVDDIVNIGKQSNINVTGFTFDKDSTATSSPTAPAATTPAAPAPATAPSNVVAVPSSVKSTTVSITIESPASYDDIMSFIKHIEINPTQMQIERVSLTKDTGNGVTSPTFSIKVYIR